MKTLIISATPKTDGHCAELTDIAVEAAKRAGAEYELVRLADVKLEVCHMCGDGWGLCNKDFRCAFGSDGFDDLQQKLAWAESLVLITPVYWSECCEAMKVFMDRVRRCEGSKAFYGSRENSLLYKKPCVMAACAGGTGNGTISTLDQMNRFVQHCGGRFYDHIGLNRWTFDYKKKAFEEAVYSMLSC